MIAFFINSFITVHSTGDFKINGFTYDKRFLKSISGYVMQDDLLHSHFTVLETLMYTAELRLPCGTSYEVCAKRVEEVIKAVDIEHCKDVTVGDTRHKGISGGERKRLCIAMELLTKPKLLFLDEPTSGLDSANAYAVVNVLKDIVRSGDCTVICTIHQPQSKIFNLFDDLILMKSGQIAYQGKAIDAINYFEKKGFPFPPLTNPADHLIDILAENKSNTLPNTGVSKEFKAPLDTNYEHTSLMIDLTKFSPWWKQFTVLLRRSFHTHIRRWDVIAMNVFVTMLVSTFVSMSVWYEIGTHQASSSKRLPALFFSVIHQGIVSSLQGTHSFPLERNIMLRERAAGTYYVSAYFLGKTMADMIVQLIGPIIYTCMVYPLVGFRPFVKKFFIFMGFMILDSAAATSLSNMISCVFVSIEMSTVILACAYEICRLYGGWFISPALLGDYPEWRFADTLSYIKYSFVGVALNEFDGLNLTCLESELAPDGSCKMPPIAAAPFNGDAYNAYYGYDRFTIGFCAGTLVLYIVCCRIISYLGLRYIKV